jgi:hypothetical protein
VEVVDEISPHASVAGIQLGLARHVVIALILIGPAAEAKPLKAWTRLVALGGEEGRVLTGRVVGDKVQNYCYDEDLSVQ